MQAYQAPLRDMQFVLYDVLKIQDVGSSIPAYKEATPDIVSAILEEAGKLCTTVLQPINRSGDEDGSTIENGVVRTAPGTIEAYRQFQQGGWMGLGCDPEFGGQGLITPVRFLFEEMMASTNMAFSLFPILTHGAYSTLLAHGTQTQKARYLPKMVSGEWCGTMNLTEAHCGTDLGLLRTRAEPQLDGTYTLHGTKIFITTGDHDLTENIVHLVLARLPDAPAGVKGISLFICPKMRVNEDGSLGQRNAVSCGSLEKKMGIKASPTCVMNYDGAHAEMLGQPNKGLSAMFTMMNGERLGVGVQGLGIAEMAYQGAASYAKSRLQMRAISGAKHPDKMADPIIVHPDVRRMLLRIRAMTEGARALALWTAMELDISVQHPDATRRQEASDLVALMTPVVKAMLTDIGFAAANDAVQVHGGHGYIREWGMEQLARDARIAQLYEGTNGIQALDLVGRKILAENGRLVQRFFKPLATFLERRLVVSAVAPLAQSFAHLQQATTWIERTSATNPEDPAAGATDYLRLFGLVAIGFMWAKMREVAAQQNDSFCVSKVMVADFYMRKILPETTSLLATLEAGSQPIMAMPDDQF